ncbi:Nuclear pore membrane glycoprotein 210 [Lamellibrachia satsuma]|nr:Nuclear pore membrane glycoprotein 210 [Lamellibrachia satsuma]
MVPVQNHRPLLINFVLLDEEGRKFDNFSSLTVRWQLSDQRVASFVDKGEASRDVDNITFDDTKVVDLHGGGSEILTVEAVVKGYESSFFSSSIKTHLRKEVKASRRLQLVDEPQITPESLTVYNHISNKAQFVIRKGSGHFHVEHTGSKLANVNYDPKTRYIEMAPLEEGMFTIVVHDLCLATDTPTRTVIFISNVYQINLWVVDKVELHKSILAKVQVTDRNNKLIPIEYFPMMELSGQTGSSIITVKESDEKQDEGSQYTALYRVRGIALGRTTLQFVAVQKEHVQVYSQAREIQVFPPLRLQPRNITLIVGSLLQVTARGGPQPESTIEYTIQSDSIASVSSGGLINALDLGVTRVIGKATGHGSHSGMVVYSEDEVTVNVVKLAGVRVFASLKRLQTGTKMPIYAVGVQENMTPFSFGSSIPPLHFHWTISNRHVADVKDLFYKSGLRPTPHSCFAMRLLAEEVGHVSVHLSVIPIPGSQLQVTGSSKLEDDIQIQVFEKLKLIGSEHYDSVMVITPNTEVQVRTNRDGSSAKMTYEVQGHIDGTHSDPVIAVTRHGQVISGSRTGQSSLLVTALEDFGVNQSVVVLVKVKPVSYIMINADTVIHTTTGSIAWLPVGTTVQLSVTFHDDIGETFFATNNKVMYRPNRFDLLQISHGNENNTLVAKATNIGQTVLKVWDGNTGRLVDYVNIVVGTIIEPRELQATLGDIVCFHCHITSLYGHTGSWSTNNAVAQIEPDSGIATAMQVGVVHIGYDVAGHHTVNEMTVLPVTRIQLNDEQVKFITNLPSKNRDCFIDVELRASDEESFPGNMHGANCSESLSRAPSKVWLSPFHCEVSLSRSLPNFIVEDLVQATPEFNPKTGTHQCRLTQVLSHDLQQVSTLDAVVQLRAVISDRPGQPEVASEFLSIPLVPAFHIATSELHLSNLLPKVRLRVSAVHAVRETLKVTSSDEALLEVLSPVVNEQEQTIHFPVALNNLEILAEKTSISAELLVVCSKTRQKQTVAVSVKLIGQTADEYKSGLQSWWRHLLHQLAKNYPNIIFLLLCIVATAACIFIAYHAVLGQRYQAATPQAGAFLNPTFSPNHFAMPGSPWMSPLNTSGSPTRLWSVDYGPYSESGSPYRRSPLQRNSPQK